MSDREKLLAGLKRAEAVSPPCDNEYGHWQDKAGESTSVRDIIRMIDDGELVLLGRGVLREIIKQLEQ